MQIDVFGRPSRAVGGQQVRFRVRSERAGFLTIVSRSPSGDITLLFPNRFAPESRIAAGQSVVVPADGTFPITVSGPFGQEYVKAIVTAEPLVDRAAAERLWAVSAFAGSDGAAGTSGTTLGGCLDAPTWAVTSLVVTTSPIVRVATPPALAESRPEERPVARPEVASRAIEIPPEPTARFSATPDRSWTRAFTSARAALGLAGQAAPQIAGQAAPPGRTIPTFDGSIVALYRPTTGTRSFGAAYAGGGLFNQIRRIDPDRDARDASGMHSLGQTYGRTTEAILAGLERDPDVLAAVPNYEFRAHAPVSVRAVTAPPRRSGSQRLGERAFWPLQWALYNGYWRTPAQRVDLRWREALASYRRPAQPVVVAVLDTGFYLDNPHLAPALWRNTGEVADNYIDDDGNGYVDDTVGWDTADRDNDPTDTRPHHSHGTFVATQIAGGAPGSVIYSMAPDVLLMPVRVLGGATGGYDAVIEGVRYAAQNGARVINMSLGAGPSAVALPGLERMFEAVYAEADRLGALVVISAGNENSDSRDSFTYPARVRAPNAITVGAVNLRGRRAGFSDHGPTVDVAAPGDAVVGHYGPTLGVEEWNGTSMAAPYVTAVAAMLFAHHPDWTPAQVRARILATVRPLPNLDVASGGVVDAAAALAD